MNKTLVSLSIAVAVSVCIAGMGAPAALAAEGAAPGGPGDIAAWTTGAKQGIGTSTTIESKVWFTLADGVLSEVYYPRVDVANSRGLELVVTDGKTFADQESTGTTHEVKLVDPRALAYEQINRDIEGRYEIEKRYVTDPKNSTVIIQVSLRSLDGGNYSVYAKWDPSLANSGLHDSSRTEGGALIAEDATSETPVASALVADKPFTATSNGFAGVNDGWTDLASDFSLDTTFTSALDGNVVQTAKLAMSRSGSVSKAILSLGFGEDSEAALTAARASSTPKAAASAATSYVQGWRTYLRNLNAAPKSVSRDKSLSSQYNVAAMTLKAHEDKTFRGANIASLTIPWGEAQNGNEAGVGGYHLVWSRDLYQVATAQLAVGDKAAAERSLDYLFNVQQRADGSFPQNSLLDGTAYWQGLQLDEVAFPVLLAWQLGRTDASTWTEHVKKAADFLVANGPSTPQERWEEEGGYSPSTIAANIAGLTAAAAIATANGDLGSAAIYTATADNWQSNVEAWTYTTTGLIGDGSYYIRIDDNGNPNDGGILSLNNAGGDYDERDVVDAGFLDLVRLGVKAPDDEAIASSLAEVDRVIKVATPNGNMWYRYNHDGYGEKADGKPYDGTGVGRLWPLLSGERGEYELANGNDASSYLRTMAESANEGFMIPEQAWDQADGTSFGFTFGEGTGSATPLAWSMAQFLRLAVSIDAGAPVETPSIVADRYAKGSLPTGPALSIDGADNSTTDADTVTLTGSTEAGTVWASVNGNTITATVVGGTYTATLPVQRGENHITIAAAGADGGTSIAKRTVVSTNLGTLIGTIIDAAGDDDGPGTYVYPTNDAFNDGAFDITKFEVYEDGDSVNLVTTVDGDITNPWGGDQLSTQRIDIYIDGNGTDGQPFNAHQGTNAQLIQPYSVTVGGSGFAKPSAVDGRENHLGFGELFVVPATHQIAFTVSRASLAGIDLSTAGYQVVMTSHASNDEGVGNIRPVYSQSYWDSSPATDHAWVQGYRFGGGAGEDTSATAARDTDTRDPNALDILVPTGQNQKDILEWESNPVTLPYVPLN